jgi:hypothetical protein
MTILDEFRRDEQRVLDRLIDGELGRHERRQLLAALDDEPGAWRRCALSFLEAQSWRWQLSRLAAEPLVAQSTTNPGKQPHAVTGARRWIGWFAIAASLVVSFGLGRGFPAASSSRQLPDGNVAAFSVAEQAIASSGSEGDAADEESPEWETLTLAANGDEGAENTFQLLVSNGEQDDPDLDEPSVVSAHLLSVLEQAGWEVKRQQRLLPVDLSDGRRVVVPIEEVDARHPERAYY